MLEFVEMDRSVTLAEQLKEDGGPVVLVNIFVVPPEGIDHLLDAWKKDAELMKRQPGFVSAQLHRGIAGSGAFLNYSVWETVAQYRAAFESPEFEAQPARYPDSAMTSPHLFRTMAVPGICVA